MNTSAVAIPLSEWVDQAWHDHATNPSAVAQALRERVSAFSDDAASANAIGLAEHLFVAHLGDREGLRSLLHDVPANARESIHCKPMIARVEWLLAALDEKPTPAIAEALRWRSLQNFWSARIAQGRTHEASAKLAHELPLALEHTDTSARRALAIACNNLAVELRTGERGNAIIDDFMLQLAEASKALWTSAGTWVHAERADYQLARCHATLGDGVAALRHARACLAAIEAHGSEPEADDCERFFAHEALAWAEHAAKNASGVAVERQRMVALLEKIDDAGLRDWCNEALAELDRRSA